MLACLAELERCHRRHDEVMTELLDAARRLAAGRPDDADIDRVHAAVSYFERAVTRHFVDEDGSVFPRLSTRRPELAAVLAELSASHPQQIAIQAELAVAARELDGEARPSAGKLLLDAAAKLADAHRAHVAREDEIFAVAHEALTAEDDAEIVAEMATRRGRMDTAVGADHTAGDEQTDGIGDAADVAGMDDLDAIDDDELGGDADEEDDEAIALGAEAVVVVGEVIDELVAGAEPPMIPGTMRRYPRAETVPDTPMAKRAVTASSSGAQRAIRKITIAFAPEHTRNVPKSGGATPSTKTAHAAKPARAAKPAKPTRAAKPAKPAKPVRAAKPAKPTRAKSTKPTRTTKSERPTVPMRAVKPAGPARTAKPAKPTRIAKPAKRNKPAPRRPGRK